MNLNTNNMTPQGLFLVLFVLLLVSLGILLACICGFHCMKPQRYSVSGGKYCDDDDGAEAGAEADAAGGARPISFALREPWFELLKTGKKKVEARLNRGPYKVVKVGDTVEIRRSRPKDDTKEYPGLRRFRAEILTRNEYKTIEDLIKGEGLKEYAPNVKTAADATAIFREFYTKDDEKEHGVVAFSFKIIEKAN